MDWEFCEQIFLHRRPLRNAKAEPKRILMGKLATSAAG
jgi:hypothetical protein